MERDRQLVLFLVFEHLEEDLAGYLSRIGTAGMPARTIQVRNNLFSFFSIFAREMFFSHMTFLEVIELAASHMATNCHCVTIDVSRKRFAMRTHSLSSYHTHTYTHMHTRTHCVTN